MAPKCLCLVLNRFGNSSAKINQRIVINENLQLSIYDCRNEVRIVSYKLVSTINHIGSGRAAGHYTDNFLADYNFLFEFDDSLVSRVNAINGCNVYMLMYQLADKVCRFILVC